MAIQVVCCMGYPGAIPPAPGWNLPLGMGCPQILSSDACEVLANSLGAFSKPMGQTSPKGQDKGISFNVYVEEIERW